jgi:hypothetical protein
MGFVVFGMSMNTEARWEFDERPGNMCLPAS